MPRKGYRKTVFTFVERSEPDRQSVEEGLRILADMIVQAYVRDGVRKGQGDVGACPEINILDAEIGNIDRRTTHASCLEASQMGRAIRARP